MPDRKDNNGETPATMRARATQYEAVATKLRLMAVGSDLREPPPQFDKQVVATLGTWAFEAEDTAKMWRRRADELDEVTT